MSRILYVEDDALLQADGEAWLEEAGYEVILTSDGEAASALLQEHGARVDGLISDIGLPGKIQGWQIACLGRQINCDLPVIYLTGHALAEYQQMKVSGSVMAPKPFNWRWVITSMSGLLLPAGA